MKRGYCAFHKTECEILGELDGRMSVDCNGIRHDPIKGIIHKSKRDYLEFALKLAKDRVKELEKELEKERRKNGTSITETGPTP